MRSKTKMGRLREDLEQWMKDVSERVDQYKAELPALAMVVADLTVQLEAHRQFLLKLGIPETEYEKEIDNGRGIRLMSPTEVLAKDDMAWVSYKAEVEGTVLHQQDNIPLRIGAEAAIFEDALIGKGIGDTVHHEAKYLGEGDAKGKMIIFDVQILKAKTKLNKEAPDVGTGAARG